MPEFSVARLPTIVGTRGGGGLLPEVSAAVLGFCNRYDAISSSSSSSFSVLSLSLLILLESSFHFNIFIIESAIGKLVPILIIFLSDKWNCN